MTTHRSEALKLIKGKRCEVLGLGISNIPLCKFLCQNGAGTVIGRDKKGESELGQSEKELKSLGVQLVTGDSYLDDIGGNEPENTVIFRSPGMRPDIEEIKNAISKGATLSSEMELFFELTPTEIIAVTGSDGKTTTTTLIGKLLQHEFEKDGSRRRVFVGGNIGEPLLPKVFEMNPDDISVVELSSFQLMTMKRSPDRAVITNVTPNHLNWHTDMNEYTESKKNICRYSSCKHLTVNRENEATAIIGKYSDIDVTYFSSEGNYYEDTVFKNDKNVTAVFERDGNVIFSDGEQEETVIKTSQIKLPGRHNLQNYMSAISATRGLVSNETVADIAETFGGVEHRCEFVRELHGVKYYNSSIDSSPTRTEAALSAFNQKVIVICGGSDKGVAFDTLANALCDKAKAVVLTGQTADKIKSAILECPKYSDGLFDIIEKSNFREAVLSAAGAAAKEDIVILSPACASFDAFKNFDERGKKFKEIINEME